MMKVLSKFNTKKRIVIFIVLFFLIIILTTYLYANLIDYISVIETKSMYAKVSVGDKYGFDVNSSALMFGRITPGGGTSTRIVTVKNYYDVPVKVEVFAEGNIKEFMIVSDNNFRLPVGTEKNMSFYVSVPENTPYGDYEGEVKIIIRNGFVK